MKKLEMKDCKMVVEKQKLKVEATKEAKEELDSCYKNIIEVQHEIIDELCQQLTYQVIQLKDAYAKTNTKLEVARVDLSKINRLKTKEEVEYYKIVVDEVANLKEEYKEEIFDVFKEHVGSLREMATRIKMELE